MMSYIDEEFLKEDQTLAFVYVLAEDRNQMPPNKLIGGIPAL
jgi:hypothetical protein